MLDDTVKKFTAKLDTSTKAVKEGETKIAELEDEVERLMTRCKELVQQKELTGEVCLSFVLLNVSPFSARKKHLYFAETTSLAYQYLPTHFPGISICLWVSYIDPIVLGKNVAVPGTYYLSLASYVW